MIEQGHVDDQKVDTIVRRALGWALLLGVIGAGLLWAGLATWRRWDTLWAVAEGLR